jgi:hypothetical protein
MSECDCKHEKDIEDLLNYRLISSQDIAIIKTRTGIMCVGMGIILAAIIGQWFDGLAKNKKMLAVSSTVEVARNE